MSRRERLRDKWRKVCLLAATTRSAAPISRIKGEEPNRSVGITLTGADSFPPLRGERDNSVFCCSIAEDVQYDC
jgi:hypothetical protein